MTTMSAKELEEWAEDIARTMEACSASSWQRTVNRYGFDYCNIKPWYNPRWMFEPRTDRVDCVFIGINPGGKPERPGPASARECGDDTCDHDRLAYYDDALSDTPYNDWLDAKCWQGSGRTHQGRVWQVFTSLFGSEEAETTMRATPCFNVCPLRTKDTNQIPDCVWKESLHWCKKVLDQLRPRVIICDGFGENGKSTWSAFKDMYGILDPQKEPEKGRTRLKWGSIRDRPLRGCTIIGVPLLTGQYFSEELYPAIESRRDDINMM